MAIRDIEKMKNFDWDEWRKKYLKFMNFKRTKVIEFLRKIDRKQNGLIPRDTFIDEIIKSSKFQKSKILLKIKTD
jgi:dystonin